MPSDGSDSDFLLVLYGMLVRSTAGRWHPRSMAKGVVEQADCVAIRLAGVMKLRLLFWREMWKECGPRDPIGWRVVRSVLECKCGLWTTRAGGRGATP